MRTRTLITSVALAVALLIAIGLGIACALLRSELRAHQDRTARFCSQVIEEMHFYTEALRMAGPAESSRDRWLSPERDVSVRMLRNGYRYCLLMAGAEQAQADEWAVRLGLGLNTAATSVDGTRQALDEAIARLRRHGY